MNEVDAIAGPSVDAEFADAFADWCYIAGIAEGEATHANRDLRFCPVVSENCQPARKGLRFADFDHLEIVAYGLQISYSLVLMPRAFILR